MHEELKPCPFCGCAVVLCKRDAPGTQSGYRYAVAGHHAVTCYFRRSDAPHEIVHDEPGSYAMPEDTFDGLVWLSDADVTVSRWNRRDIPEVHAKDPERCGHPGCRHHVTHPCEGCGRTHGISGKVNDDE